MQSKMQNATTVYKILTILCKQKQQQEQ